MTKTSKKFPKKSLKSVFEGINLRNGGIISTLICRSTLSYGAVRRSDHRGHFLCEASNTNLSSATSTSAVLTLKCKSRSITLSLHDPLTTSLPQSKITSSISHSNIDYSPCLMVEARKFFCCYQPVSHTPLITRYLG